MPDPLASNRLHRLAKLVMDTGEARSPEEAEQILRSYQIGIQVDPDLMASPAYQAALLTAVNTGRRAFLGGVWVTGELDIPLRIPWMGCTTLRQAVSNLQGRVTGALEPHIPTIYFSSQVARDQGGEFGLRPVIRGWSGGVIPAYDDFGLSLDQSFTPAGVLAGALAVSEAFQFLRGNSPLSGHRAVGLPLWSPHERKDWLGVDPGPSLQALPSNLWLIGLGHLGQAFLWSLGFLPYEPAAPLHIVLQDVDDLEHANDSTSLLTHLGLVGARKTRAMAAWCKDRGFNTTLIERSFAADFKVNDKEPRLALCGVDNPEARAALEQVGFSRILEAGLGKGAQEYLSFQLHAFPASRSADSYWAKQLPNDPSTERLLQQPAYQSLAQKGMDRCGLVEIAGRSVGASFVGAVTSALAIAEILRLVHGESMHEVIDGDLRSSGILSTVLPNRTDLAPFNPGIIRLRADANAG